MAARKVLYLEDNPLDAQMAGNALQRLGVMVDLHVVETADDYRGALAREAYDLVISDSGVPGCEGHESLWLAQQIQPGVPFLYFSGHADQLAAEAGLDAGAQDFIDKRDLWRLKHTARMLLERPDGNSDTALLHDYSRRQAQLIQAVKQLGRARCLDDIAHVVRTVTRELVLADGATFVLREGDQCYYLAEDAISPLWQGRRFPMSACVSGWAMQHKQQVVIPDIYLDDRVPHAAYRPTFVKSMVMTPVRQTDPIAAIGTYWAQPCLPSHDELALLQDLADSVALALENVTSYDSLQQRLNTRADQLRAVNHELEAFSYSLSHDLRAPLRAINGFGNILLEDHLQSLSPDGRHYLLRICAEAARMNDQIDDLHKLFLLSSQPVRRSTVNLSLMAGGVMGRLRQNDGRRTAAASIAPNLTVSADHGLLMIALEHLLGNAWKYTSRSPGAVIEVGVQPSAHADEVFYVRDNGVGFDSSKADKLFSPFQRYHTDREFNGTGIGLAMAQRIVHLHGGRIWAESAEGEGACFYFTLPVAD